MKTGRIFIKAVLSVFLIFILVCSSQAFLITSFCPDTWLKGEGDEFFVLSGTGSLNGIMVSDGEGSVRFPENSYCSGLVVVAREGEAYEKIHKNPPDYEMYDTSPAIPDAIRTGNLQMGNSGDELTLYKNSKVIQTVSWPGDVSKGEGRVHFLKDGIWDARPYFIGQSEFSPETFEDVTLTAFVSPDCSYEVLKDAVLDAKSDIKLNVYEFTSPYIAEILKGKSKSGVKLTVLLEGGPVGGISSDENYAVSEITGAGASVYSVETEIGPFHTPYRYNHAKYMITDDENILLASENFGLTGFPPQGKTGNRGYGVYVNDKQTSEYFKSVFEEDINGGWVGAFTPKRGSLSPDEESLKSFSPEFKPEVFTGVFLTPVISPDTSYLIEDMISNAKYSVDIEQAYIKNWSTGKNPYLEAAIDAARRGANVRILLDSYWFNTEGDLDNDEMAEYINSVAKSENLPLEAGLADLNRLGIEKIHNKAVITDGESVLISSVNWNENSPSYNREAGVILSGGNVSKYYKKVFDYDWERRQGAESAVFSGLSENDGYGAKCLTGIIVIFLFAVIYLVRRR